MDRNEGWNGERGSYRRKNDLCKKPVGRRFMIESEKGGPGGEQEV